MVLKNKAKQALCKNQEKTHWERSERARGRRTRSVCGSTGRAAKRWRSFWPMDVLRALKVERVRAKFFMRIEREANLIMDHSAFLNTWE